VSFSALKEAIEYRAEWVPSRLKFALVRNDGGVWGEDFDEEGVVVLRSTEVALDGSWRISDPARRRLSPRDQKAGLLLEGDLLVTKSSGSEDHLGKTALVSQEVAALRAAFSNFMQRLRVSREHEPRYYYYLLNSYVGREYLGCLGSTTTGLRNLSGGLLAELAISGPPSEEQAQIAKFLDYETARIDALIEKQQQLIALLKEKRQAVISHAVTKGLNPDAPMRDSGVEWLGEVPAHWQVTRIAYVFVKSNAGEVIDKSFWGEGPELLYTCNRTPMKSDYLGFPEWKRTAESDLLLTRNGTPYVHKPKAGSIYSNVVQRITLSNDYSRNYLAYCLGYSARSMRGYGVSIESLNFENWKSLSFAHPGLKEQAEIVEFLDHQMAKIDTLTLKAESGVQLLQERRTALISAAVTGKIDVRGWKAPESAAEAEVA
jgi:type I restriction enzyme S subunit